MNALRTGGNRNTNACTQPTRATPEMRMNPIHELDVNTLGTNLRPQQSVILTQELPPSYEEVMADKAKYLQT